MLLFGYGTVTIANVPGNADVRINGHIIHTATLKLHPGTYQLVISSPATKPYESTIHVSIFKTTAYHPAFQQRDPNAVASSVIGSFGSNEPISMYHVQWFNSDTWLVGILLPGNSPLVLHYDAARKQWVAAYFGVSGYPTDITKLPSNVATYVKYVETTYAPG